MTPTSSAKWNGNNLLWCAGQCVFSAVFLFLSWVIITQVVPIKAARAEKTAEARRAAI